jgi:hypothetical protein
MNYFELLYLTNPPTADNTIYHSKDGQVITKKEFELLKQKQNKTYNNKQQIKKA